MVLPQPGERWRQICQSSATSFTGRVSVICSKGSAALTN
jgi:hypothetical protein